VAAGLHSVESTGSPAFTGGDEFSDAGSQVTVKFDSPGTYTYQCGIHGDAMTGRVVVQ
jgi:plastocyanin